MSGIAYGLVGDSVKQALLEAETSVNTYAPPDLLHYGPWAAKVWADFEQSSAHGLNDSYNVDEITDGGGSGVTDFVWDEDFSGTAYGLAGMGGNGNQVIASKDSTKTASALSTSTLQVSDGAAVDGTLHNQIVGYGDQ